MFSTSSHAGLTSVRHTATPQRRARGVQNSPRIGAMHGGCSIGDAVPRAEIRHIATEDIAAE
jgi:hypothetical protein